MKKNKIFVACDSSNISKIQKIIKYTVTDELKIGYKFGLEFLNSKKIVKSIEIVYGLRNFIGNSNKFSNEYVFINLKSDSEFTEISIEDDGPGYPKDIISKIGEPYLKSNNPQDKSKTGLGLGLFIGKTLLEKNFASVICRNSKTRSGAEVIIKWRNKDLFNIQ